jgi:hypothetical protein
METTPEPNAAFDALEQRLLDAARHDRIPDPLGARMAEGLGLGAGASLPAASLASQSALAKLGLWAALPLALAAIGGWVATRPSPRAEQDAAAPRAVTSSAAPVAPALAPTQAPVIAPALTPPSATAPLAQPTPAASARGPERGDDDALRAEIALLDRARAALQREQSERALQLLDQHRQRFTQPTLAPEAEALRIEALHQRGAHAQAEALSARFAAAYPTHPLRSRMRAATE